MTGTTEHRPLEPHPDFHEQRAMERFSPAATSTSFAESPVLRSSMPPDLPFFEERIPVRSSRLLTFRSIGRGIPISVAARSSVRIPGFSERYLTKRRAYSEEADILNMGEFYTETSDFQETYRSMFSTVRLFLFHPGSVFARTTRKTFRSKIFSSSSLASVAISRIFSAPLPITMRF